MPAILPATVRMIHELGQRQHHKLPRALKSKRKPKTWRIMHVALLTRSSRLRMSCMSQYILLLKQGLMYITITIYFLRFSIEKSIYYYNYYRITIPVYENYILLLLLITVYYSYLLLLFSPVVLRTVEPRLFEALAGIRRPTATDLQRMSSPLHPTSYVKVQVVHRDFCYGHARSLHARLGASTKEGSLTAFWMLS